MAEINYIHSVRNDTHESGLTLTGFEFIIYS